MLHKIFSFSIYVHISQQQTNHVVLTNLPAQNLPLSSLWIFPICGSLNSKKRRKKNSKLNPNSISLSFTLRLFLTPSPLLLHTHTHTKIMDIIPLTNIFRNICVTSSRIGCGMGNLNVWKKFLPLTEQRVEKKSLRLALSKCSYYYDDLFNEIYYDITCFG